MAPIVAVPIPSELSGFSRIARWWTHTPSVAFVADNSWKALTEPHGLGVQQLGVLVEGVPGVYRLGSGQATASPSHRTNLFFGFPVPARDAQPRVPGKVHLRRGRTILSPPRQVAGPPTELRLILSDAVSRHAAVVSEIRDAIKLLTGQRAHVLAGEPTKGRCGECECCRRTPAIKVPKRNHAPKKTSKTCRQGNIITGPEPKKGPVIDTNFTVDHIPFTTKRSKKQMRKPCKGRKEPRFGCTLTVVSFQYIFIELFSSAGYLQTHSMNVFQVDLTSDDGVGKSRGRITPKPAVEATSPPGRQKRDVHPLDSTGVVNLSGQHSIHVEAIPKSMNLVFRPTEEMNLSLVDLAVAAYIFNQDLSESEVLVDVGDCFASRGALMTLAPKREVVDDVLNAVVRMLTNGSKRSCWFLPTIIMQAALCGRSLTSANMTSIRNNYMRSKVDQTTRIYQPMWSDQHWYLMIVDIPRMKLVYLDSLRDPREADARKTAIIRVALYLEGVTLGKSWLSGPEAMRPRFSTFEFEEPEVPQQQGDSMDCGVWVAQWMIREHLWQDYGVQHVYNATRMRLAVDLVMKSHNKLAEDAVSKAFRHWKQKLV
ncbi:uncharacterized protein LOC107627917 [Arachis ipaensis]|uniref:uncharacterized protein LOC107627917 n=1 Tax=Arachis ipaensis TaxID=130454 RepID=UPI000A2B0819|nr:uncharacterized protein LOC107627917 [Arachis ipaensis]